jgi:shikimate kinase
MRRNIALIGPMAAGKSTIGKILSQLLGFSFVDIDQLIEEKEHLTVAEIFKEKGEEYFREQEGQALAELILQPNKVIATGGGAIRLAKNRALLKSHSFVVYLKVSVETQLARTVNDLSRPLINTVNRKDKLRQLQIERESLYSEMAALIVDANCNAPEQIACSIKQNYLNMT